ncbi:MAG: iron-sulfur cluster assembly scaffold protein [Bacteriovoracaceae bacterium]|nr:iron-sulfur cluster assembly scaffold protein [Bacteriovoracaceae bacterium]
MAWEYSEKIKDLFMNAITNEKDSHFGEIKDADGMGRHGSITCGDTMVFYFKVKKDDKNPLNDRIIQTKYKTFGCTSAIASSEALCHMIEEKQMTPAKALQLTNQDIVDFLGGMPSQKIHCSVMGTEVLKIAVADWAIKRGVNLQQLCGDLEETLHDDEGKIVCDCYDLTHNYIKRKIVELDLKNAEDITNAIKAGGGCGLCVNRPNGLNAILQEVWGVNSQNNNATPVSGKNFDELREKIEHVFKNSISSEFNKIDLVEIKGNKVYCVVTKDQKNKLEEHLRTNIDENIIVIDV